MLRSFVSFGRRRPRPARAGWLALLTGLAALAAQPAAAAGAPARELAVCADPSNLPFSNDARQGFENRIAQLIADDLHATLRYAWNMQRRSFLRRTLNSGACDLVLGVPVGLQGVSATRPYYRSTYVFVTARGRHLDLHSLDDARLGQLKIGLHALGAEGANPPPAMSLGLRGLGRQVEGYPMWGEESEASPSARIIDAVAAGEIDVAVVWGPIAGYFAQRHRDKAGDQLVLAPVDPDPRLPTLAFAYELAMGVRRGDDALKAEIQAVLDRHGPEIQAILAEFGVPLLAISPASTVPEPARAGT